MEWVEITAKTIEEAKNLALDRLGVAADDAEFEVLEEPRSGLFGRVRGEARVRARVRPTAVRPKRDRRERTKPRTNERRRDSSDENREPAPRDAAQDVPSPAGSADESEAAIAVQERREHRSRNNRKRTADNGRERSQKKENNVEDEVNVNPEEVGAAAAAFMTGLAEALGSSATTEVLVDGIELEVRVDGPDLGLLIGPGGRTLTAVQDLARVAAQRKLGDHETRLKIDIAGYREKRREALEKFARTVANDVLATGKPKALEPMSSADRKIVHDAINDLDGVASRSDGEEPARRVVIVPA